MNPQEAGGGSFQQQGMFTIGVKNRFCLKELEGSLSTSSQLCSVRSSSSCFNLYQLRQRLLGSSQLFSQVSALLTFFSQLSSTVLNDLCTSFQIFAPLFTFSHDFSLLVTSSQRLSSLSTSSQFFSTLLTSVQLFRILFSSVEFISSANLFNSPPLRSLLVTCSTCVCLISRQLFRNH